MNSKILVLVLTVARLITSSPIEGRPHSTTYDQKQSGKYNIHLNIKDVAIIAVGSDDITAGIGDSGSFYEDYYDYDLEDFTISPISAALGATTKKPVPTVSNATEVSALNVTSLSEIETNSSSEASEVPLLLLASISAEENETEDAEDNLEEVSDDDSIKQPAEISANPPETSSENNSDDKIEQVSSEQNSVVKLSQQTVTNSPNGSQNPAIEKVKPSPVSPTISSVTILDDNDPTFDKEKIVITTFSPKPAHTNPSILSSSLSPFSSSVIAPVSPVSAVAAAPQEETNVNQIPVHIIMEPVLQPKHRQVNRPSYRSNNRLNKIAAMGQHKRELAGTDANLGHGKARRNGELRRRCARNQARDRHGRCQNRKSTSGV